MPFHTARDSPSSAAVVEPTKVEHTYFYGFNKELKLAWRTSAKDKKERKEMARPFNVENLGPDDFPVAVWEDRHEHKMDNVKVSEYNSLIEGKRNKSEVAVLWSGEHCATHHKLTIKPRPDRSMLVVLYEQQKMVPFRMVVILYDLECHSRDR